MSIKLQNKYKYDSYLDFLDSLIKFNKAPIGYAHACEVSLLNDWNMKPSGTTKKNRLIAYRKAVEGDFKKFSKRRTKPKTTTEEWTPQRLKDFLGRGLGRPEEKHSDLREVERYVKKMHSEGKSRKKINNFLTSNFLLRYKKYGPSQDVTRTFKKFGLT